MTRDETIEKVARALCVAAGDDPDKLEPGNSPSYLLGADSIGVVCVDGTTSKGEEGFFVWRLYAEQATIAVTVAMAIENAENARLRTALEEIRDLPGEINTSNYNHDDAVRLNDAFIETYHIARAALEGK
jgi:hypothetical protein